MKKFCKAILIISILINLGDNLFARNIQNDSLNFSGKIVDDQKNPIPGRIVIYYSTIDAFDSQEYTFSSTFNIDSKGAFRFNLPDLNKPYKIFVKIKNTASKTIFDYEFYAESKDKIRMNIVTNMQNEKVENSATFEGNGSEKYNLVWAINREQYWKGYWRELKMMRTGSSFNDSNDINLEMKKLSLLLLKYKRKKDSILNTSNLGSEMRSIINYEFGNYNQEWGFRTKQFKINNPSHRTQINQNYLLYRSNFYEAPDRYAQFSMNLLRYTNDRVVLDLMIDKGSDKIELKSLYDTLKTNYSSSFRDRLLAYTLTHVSTTFVTLPHTLSLVDSLAKDALTFVKLPYIKIVLKKVIDHISRTTNNAKVIDGQFIGLDGKIFNLNSLKGKVFLIHTWFKGCIPCADWHKMFEKEIYPIFKDNKQFILVSLSMDQTKENWLSGIESKLYTSKESINIWTGNFMNHQFLKYYMMQAGGKVMLVDADGHILFNPLSGYLKEVLAAEITSALKKSNSRSK